MKKAMTWARLTTVGAAVVATLPLTVGAASAATTYTMADVQAHSTAASCWSAINGGVYDLTNWITSHPGGQSAIKGLCGKDGSASFNNQHGGSSKVASTLAGFKIGDLQGAAAGQAAAAPTTTAAPTAGGYTMRQVHQHRRLNDCWSAIGGNVYDLTTWAQGRDSRHGLRQVCGHDGTRQFLRLTNGRSNPAAAVATIDQYKLGALVKAAPVASSDDDGDDDRSLGDHHGTETHDGVDDDNDD